MSEPSYKNGKPACVGDAIVGRDNGGNVVMGCVVGIRPDGRLRVTGSPMIIEPGKCVRAEDALGDEQPDPHPKTGDEQPNK